MFKALNRARGKAWSDYPVVSSNVDIEVASKLGIPEVNTLALFQNQLQ